MEEGFVVRFRGVRGCHPTPGPATVRYGGNTSCLEVWAGGRLIILDAGTGVISLGESLQTWHQETGQPIVASMFFTHTHHDHTQGFPFFTPAYLGSSTLYMFGPRTFYQDVAEALERAMLPPTFPVSLDELPSLRIISNVTENEAILIGPENEPQIRNIHREPIDAEPDVVRVRVMRTPFHPGGGASIFRIEWQGKSLVYASDTEGVQGGDTYLIRFARGSDLLVHDAQFNCHEYVDLPRQGWGHSTPEMAAQVAEQARAKRLVLFHHDPDHDDDQLDRMGQEAQALFPATMMAYEGLTVRL